MKIGIKNNIILLILSIVAHQLQSAASNPADMTIPNQDSFGEITADTIPQELFDKYRDLPEEELVTRLKGISSDRRTWPAARLEIAALLCSLPEENTNLIKQRATSAMQTAFSLHDHHLVSFLLSMGADQNERYCGAPIIGLCCNLDTAKLLLTYGANPNGIDNYGISALMISLTSNQQSPEHAKLLIEHGACVNYKNRLEQFTPLMYLIKHYWFAAVAANFGAQKALTFLQQKAALLLRAGAETFWRTDSGKTSSDLLLARAEQPCHRNKKNALIRLANLITAYGNPTTTLQERIVISAVLDAHSCDPEVQERGLRNIQAIRESSEYNRYMVDHFYSDED